MRLAAGTPIAAWTQVKARAPVRRTLTPAYERPPTYKTATATPHSHRVLGGVVHEPPPPPPPPATPLGAAPPAGATEWDCQFVDVWGCGADSGGEEDDGGPPTPTLEATIFGAGGLAAAGRGGGGGGGGDAPGAAAASGTIYRKFEGFSPEAPPAPVAAAGAGEAAVLRGCTFLGNCSCADCAEDARTPAARASTLTKLKAGRVSQLSSMFQ